MVDRDIYIHTNVPSPYRKHQFELFARSFRTARVYFCSDHAEDRPWENSTQDWQVECRRANPVLFKKVWWLSMSMPVVRDLFAQRWGSIHLVAYCSFVEHLLISLSGILGHSIVFSWNDAGFPEQVGIWKRTGRGIMSWIHRMGCRKGGVFTPGILGEKFSMALGFRKDQIVNAYFSHDIKKFATYRESQGAHARSRIRQQLGIDDDRICLLNISRYLELKRLVDLAEALKIIEETKPAIADRCDLILIGDGECRDHEPILATLKRIRVHLIHQMPPDEVLAYYCASDLFVFPSEGDIWGLVVNEALSMGLPVICTERIGAAELVKDDYNGYRVSVRDPKAMATAVTRVVGDEELRKRLAENAKNIGKEWNSQMGLEALLKKIGERDR